MWVQICVNRRWGCSVRESYLLRRRMKEEELESGGWRLSQETVIWKKGWGTGSGTWKSTVVGSQNYTLSPVTVVLLGFVYAAHGGKSSLCGWLNLTRFGIFPGPCAEKGLGGAQE